MAFDAIESVFIYLWFEIILQKYGKGSNYFDHDCLIFFNRIFWEIGGTFQHNLPLFGEKSPFCTILTKSRHKFYYFAKF